MKYNILNNFSFGSTDNALRAIRNSKVHQNSAKKITDFTVEDTGSLKVRKDFSEHVTFAYPVLKYLDTKYTFFIVITSLSIEMWRYDDNDFGHPTLIDAFAHGRTLGESFNAGIFNEFVYFIDDNEQLFVGAIDATANTITDASASFLAELKMPFVTKVNIEGDLYKTYSYDTGFIKSGGNAANPADHIYEIKIELVNVYTEDQLELYVDASGDIYMGNSGIKLDRLYIHSSGNPTTSNIAAFAPKTGSLHDAAYPGGVNVGNIGALADQSGKYILFLRNYNEDDTHNKTYIGPKVVDWGASTSATDTFYAGSSTSSGTYYTKLSPTDNKGRMIYGKRVDFKLDIVDICEYQNRLFIATYDKLYASKVLDYNDFVQELKPDSSYYIRLGTINESFSRITKLFVGDALIVATSGGVFTFADGQMSDYQNSMGLLRVATTYIPSFRNEFVFINGVYYFVEVGGTVVGFRHKADRGSLIDYDVFIVEKYLTYKRGWKWLCKVNIEQKDYLLAQNENTEEVALYDFAETDSGQIYRKVYMTINSVNKMHSHLGNLIEGITIYALTENNFTSPKLVLNLQDPPASERNPYPSPSRGSYTPTSLQYMNNAKVYLENLAGAVKTIKFCGNTYASQQPLGNQDVYQDDVYEILNTISPIDIEIELEVAPTNTDVKLLAVELGWT